MCSHPWFRLLRVCLLFVVLIHISVAVYTKSLEDWIVQCNCSCLTRKRALQNCTVTEAFTIDKRRELQNTSSFLHLSTIRKRLLPCEEVLKENNFKYTLLNLSCEGERKFVIYRERLATKLKPALTPTSKQQEEEQGNSEPPNKLVIGLSIGLGLMVAIVAWLTWIRCRRRRPKEKPEEKKQNLEFGYIDEEEDSVPYRIVDLQTNISCDASGYTFLEAPKQDEENPYMKLQPRCKRVHGKECTAEEATHCFEEIVDDEDEDRPYHTLQPTNCGDSENKDCTKTDNFEAIADEPVYFMLEKKENSTNS